MTQRVYCCGCGAAFLEDTRPYPLHNGLCATCVRDMRRPSYALAEEMVTLRAQHARQVEALTQHADALAGAVELLTGEFPADEWPRRWAEADRIVRAYRVR